MRIAILIVASIITLNGCKHRGAVSPQEQVVTQPTSPKFDLSGTWIATPKIDMPGNSDQLVSIHQTADGVFLVDLHDGDKLTIELRTMKLGNHEDYAIADVLASAGETPLIRFLGIVAMKGDSLTVWWIESKNLAKMMSAVGCSAVIEHSTFGSKVFADANDLVKCIEKHSRELVGEPATFTRQAK